MAARKPSKREVEERERALDAQRSASMADEGGAAAAVMDLRGQLEGEDPCAPERRRVVLEILPVIGVGLGVIAALGWYARHSRPEAAA